MNIHSVISSFLLNCFYSLYPITNKALFKQLSFQTLLKVFVKLKDNHLQFEVIC